MIRLDAAGRDQRVATLHKRVRHEEFQLTRFITPQGQAGLVVALDINRRATQKAREPRQRLKRSRQMRERNPRNGG